MKPHPHLVDVTTAPSRSDGNHGGAALSAGGQSSGRADAPDEYDCPAVEPWSWTRRARFIAVAAFAAWAAVAAMLFAAGVLTW